jgi:hypothetical protein
MREIKANAHEASHQPIAFVAWRLVRHRADRLEHYRGRARESRIFSCLRPFVLS